MTPFQLEDFFDQYEHCAGVLNLASSDALPWPAAVLADRGINLVDALKFSFSYPDVTKDLTPHLRAFCKPPEGMEILPTSGAAEAIALVLHEYADASRDKRDTCIALPSPSYGAFPGLAELLQLRFCKYTYDPHKGWRPDLDEMRDLASRCTALVVINPHNPSGHCLPLEFLRHLADALAKHDGILIVDEVFLVPGEAPSAVSVGPNVVLIASLSKTYGLPGLRLGWIAASKGRVRRLRTVQQYLTLTLNKVTVALGAAILPKHAVFSRAQLVNENRRVLLAWANSTQGMASISRPSGGTTVCLMMPTQRDETTMFRKLLDGGVLLVPGSRCFEFTCGTPWFRIGYACASDTLRDGLRKIADVLNISTSADAPV